MLTVSFRGFFEGRSVHLTPVGTTTFGQTEGTIMLKVRQLLEEIGSENKIGISLALSVSIYAIAALQE